VYPLAAGPTGGPSPYGAWYEQHWVTNAVLLAAAHQEEFGTAVNEEQGEGVGSVEPAAAEAGDSDAGPRPCCRKSSCSHRVSSSVESQDAESDAVLAPADGGNAGGDATPSSVEAAPRPRHSADKVRY